MADLWMEFSKVAFAHLVAVASPGPDFALVLRQSLVHGRRTALWTSLGVGTGVMVHAAYSVLGFGLLLRSSETWFQTVKFAGAAYIAWLGIQSLRARPRDGAEVEAISATTAFTRESNAFTRGFLTNALNPKATLFFLSLYLIIVDARTPKIVQAGYGLWMAVATAVWFACVSIVFTHAPIRRRFLRQGHWIDRLMGVVFLALAASLVRASLN